MSPSDRYPPDLRLLVTRVGALRDCLCTSDWHGCPSDAAGATAEFLQMCVSVSTSHRANHPDSVKRDAEDAMDAAACIGCGACVAACPNGSASLFTGAKISHLGLLLQGQPERYRACSPWSRRRTRRPSGRAPGSASARTRVRRHQHRHDCTHVSRLPESDDDCARGKG
jgi:ferredoxin